MKSIKTLILLLSITAAWLTSCSSGPSKAEWERYRAELLRYFPYHNGDVCVFENTENDSSIVFRPFDEYNPYDESKDGSFLQTRINIENCGPFEKCGASGITLDALWQGTDDKKASVLMILEHWGGNKMDFYCYYIMLLGKDNPYQYSGITTTTYPQAEILSYLPDTLVLPITRYEFPTDKGRSHTDISSQGAYFRLVKDHGLTDFSLDGTTVWHQVKK